MTLELVETAETETPVQPLCAACGRHPVLYVGWLCHVMDKDDLWNCCEKSAYFSVRFNLSKKNIRWAQS